MTCIFFINSKKSCLAPFKRVSGSDSFSSNEKSWFEIIQEHLEKENNQSTKVYQHNPPKTKEQTYYREIFDSIFPSPCEKLIPYFWMPKYIEGAHDASARTLKIYNKS